MAILCVTTLRDWFFQLYYICLAKFETFSFSFISFKSMEEASSGREVNLEGMATFWRNLNLLPQLKTSTLLHFYIGLRRHLIQFFRSSCLHTELSKIACHHDHVIITWNGCKSGGRLGWWTRKSWKDSSTFTLLSKISGSPPHNSEHLLKCIWNIQQEVKCTAIAKYKLQTPPLHHLPACWHDWEVRNCVKTQRKLSAIVLFGPNNSILASVRWEKDAEHTSVW